MPRKKSNKPSVQRYFTEETEGRIIEYIQETHPAKKEIIYVKHIMPAFKLIIEAIYNRYFKRNNYFSVSDEEVQMECLSHLTEKISTYSEAASRDNETSKGRAFGYFSVIAKNYFIQKNKKSYSELKNNYPIMQDSGDGEENYSKNIITDIEDKDYKILATESDDEILIKELSKKLEANIPNLFDNDRDKNIALGIVNLLEINKMIDNFNKKAIFFYLKEITGEKTQRITSVINIIKDSYLSMRKEIMNTIQYERY